MDRLEDRELFKQSWDLDKRVLTGFPTRQQNQPLERHLDEFCLDLTVVNS
jgi:hypothetical protein